MDTATILVVCTGNVRRSPAIEAMLRDGVGQVSGLARYGIAVMSAGTEALVGYEMDPMVADEAAHAGVRADHHQAYALSVEDIEASDIIITAERSHRRAVARLVPSAVTRTFTLIEIAALAEQLGRAELSAADGPAAGDVSARLRTLVGMAPLEKARRMVRRPVDDDLLDLRRRTPREVRRLVTEIYGYVHGLLQVLEPEPAQLTAKRRTGAPAPSPAAPVVPQQQGYHSGQHAQYLPPGPSAAAR